ncbi:MAG: DUF5074 domain-containing protein [Fermentimonas sp.]|jgi:DNA-binding beta-propeller fold protein YncE
MSRKYFIYFLLLIASTLLSCREEYEILYSEQILTNLGAEDLGNLKGFYLLNEGNMGSNMASLDYFDFDTGIYHRNIYSEANPSVVKELGDVGNDIKIYGGKMYAVINVSNYIEVMDAKTAKHIGKIDIPNARYIEFHGGKAYVSSYVAPVEFDKNSRVGYIAEIDTATLEVTRTVNVGYQPEELVVANGKIYVANSGGYLSSNYDNTVSVIDLNTFIEEKRIEVAINLHRLRLTKHNELVVSSRGDNHDVPSKLFFIDLETEKVTDSIDMAVSNLDIVGDSAYVFAVEWNYQSNRNDISYGVIDIKNKKILSRNFIKDGSEKDIAIPYGIKVNPVSKNIYITDAVDYVSPGTLFCYDNSGKLRWRVDTGDVPAHFAFLYE